MILTALPFLGRCDKELLKFLKKHFQYVVYSGLNNLDAKYDQIICDGTQISYDVVTRLIEQVIEKSLTSAKHRMKTGMLDTVLH